MRRTVHVPILCFTTPSFSIFKKTVQCRVTWEVRSYGRYSSEQYIIKSLTFFLKGFEDASLIIGLETSLIPMSLGNQNAKEGVRTLIFLMTEYNVRMTLHSISFTLRIIPSFLTSLWNVNRVECLDGTIDSKKITLSAHTFIPNQLLFRIQSTWLTA